ncbi:MAG: hypothetical protein D3910_10675, partial [Candidatus Electrothrix sp. ATG2]|nr:hypothetical protein [Candidatus Electrothrix sp. ATG2]
YSLYDTEEAPSFFKSGEKSKKRGNIMRIKRNFDSLGRSPFQGARRSSLSMFFNSTLIVMRDKGEMGANSGMGQIYTFI